MAEPLSLLDAIRKGDVGASLITTFNANLPYYEDFILRRLASVGCRNNVLLVDHKQLASAYLSEATRPRRAGIDYTLVPIEVQGAFHPKICLLAGKKRASLFVGSHNLTVSGFGYNREVTNHLEISGANWKSEPSLFSQAWGSAREWVASMSDRLPSALLESAYALDKAFGGVSENAVAAASVGFLAQFPGRESLLDQLTRNFAGEVKQITVLGAFFDARAEFLTELLRRWPKSKVVVGIDPDTVWLSNIPSDARLRIVDASQIGPSKRKGKGYLHAKAIHFEIRNGRNVFASGSANPSEPAWLSRRPDANVEAMLVRFGAEADQCAKAIGLTALPSAKAVSPEQMKHVAERSRQALPAIPAGAKVLVGVADYERRAITAPLAQLGVATALVATGESDLAIPGVELDWAGGELIGVNGDLSAIRSIKVKNNQSIVGRVLIHHPEVIARRVMGAAREPTIDLLRQLGSEDADISRVLPHIEKLIFSDTVPESLRLPAKRSDQKKAETPGDRPATLEVSLAETSRHRRLSLFSSSSDLAALIDILANHVPVVDETKERGFDAFGRSEEEQIGQDDEEFDEPSSESKHSDVSDADIAELVGRRATRLCNRMIKALGQSQSAPGSTSTLLVQLVAVLAVLQELEHLSRSERWYRAHLSLLPDFDEMCALFEAVAHSLFSPGDTRLDEITEGGSNVPEELDHLLALMLWLAWWCEVEWTTPREAAMSRESASGAARDNSRLIRLLWLSGGEEATWVNARRFVDQTLPAQPSLVIAAGRWFERHKTVARQLSTLAKSHSPPLAGPALLGDIVHAPPRVSFLTIAVDGDGSYISVVERGGKELRFLATRVVTLARI